MKDQTSNCCGCGTPMPPRGPCAGHVHTSDDETLIASWCDKCFPKGSPLPKVPTNRKNIRSNCIGCYGDLLPADGVPMSG